MHLHPHQFKVQIKAHASHAYEVRAEKFLDYMDRRGASTASGMASQLKHLDHYCGSDCN